MSIGFLGLMTEGILTSISFRDLEGNERTKQIWKHLGWQFASIICIVGGFATIYQNKVKVPHHCNFCSDTTFTTSIKILKYKYSKPMKACKASLFLLRPEYMYSSNANQHLLLANKAFPVTEWFLSLFTQMMITQCSDRGKAVNIAKKFSSIPVCSMLYMIKQPFSYCAHCIHNWRINLAVWSSNQ